MEQLSIVEKDGANYHLYELDPAGIGFLMAAFNDSEEVGHKLYFMTMSNEADKAIAATGFKYLFNLINSVTEVN